MRPSLSLLRGTLDGVLLKALENGPRHGYGIVDWVRTVTKGDFDLEDGALYTALHRMEKRGWSKAEWGVSEAGRRAKFYSLTAKGRRQLDEKQKEWQRYAEAVARVFAAGRT